MQFRQLLAALLILLFAGACASAQEFINIGKLKVRADSPLAKGEYPRLMITRAHLPAIRARMNHPEMQTYLAQARDLVKILAKINKTDTLLLATLYQVTGGRIYAEMAKKKLGNPSWYPQWIFAFDMVAETMTDAERADYARKILALVKTRNKGLLLALAVWGNGFDRELTPYIESSYAREVISKLHHNNRWSRGRGGSSMGHFYNGCHFFSKTFAALMGWTHATGEDVLTGADFAHNTPAWYVYHYLQWKKSRQLIRIGITSPSHPEALMPWKYSAEDYVMLDITRTKNGLGQWWQREFIGKWTKPKWPMGNQHAFGLSGRLLWLDPSIPSMPPEKFPETRLFGVNGHVIMRSDWTEDATVALFRCGRFGTLDGYNGRNNLDNLHFIIYKNGYLAPDTGILREFRSINQSRNIWKMIPGNIHNYGKQTIAHNSITVGRKPISTFIYTGQKLGFIPRGGQGEIRLGSRLKAWGLKTKLPDGFKHGDITAYSTSPEYDYASGDATHSYPPERVQKITRQFVYIKPDTFVVFDRVMPTDEKLEVIWNLHAYKEPEWDGKREPDPAWPPDKQFVIAEGGKRTLNPHPGGHFVHTDGDTFRIANRRSVMEVKTLLPMADERVVRTIGGEWHDFEVDGVNFGPTEATYARLAKHKGYGGVEGVGAWRIEVSPTRVSGEAHFLHVLQTGKSDALKSGEVSLVKVAGRTGAKIVLAGKSCEVTFNTQGPTGGHITIAGGAKPLDEDLVTRIEDHYDRWKADPRYQDWMTNEYMRTVIFPYGKKPD